MNTHRLQVTSTGGQRTFETAEGYDNVRAYIGKHGELRIVQVKKDKDVDIEKGKEMETFRYEAIYTASRWLEYSNVT